MKVRVISIVIDALGTIPPKGGKESWRLGNKRSGDNPDFSIIKIGENTGKSPGDLRKLAFIQTLIKKTPLKLIIILLIIIISTNK